MRADKQLTKPTISVLVIVFFITVLFVTYFTIYIGITFPYSPRYAVKVRLVTKQTYDVAQLAGDSDLLVVSIDAQKQIRLNQKTIPTGELESSLRHLLEQRTANRKVVYVKAAPKLRYQDMMEIIDLVKNAGANTIFLPTDFLN